MAEDNAYNCLLEISKDIFSLGADRESSRDPYDDSFNWYFWIHVPLKLMAEEGDSRATTILENRLTFFESKAAVLGIAEQLLELVLRKVPERMRIRWLKVTLELALESGNLDMAICLLDNSDISQHVCGGRASENLPLTFLHTAVGGCNDDPAIVNALLDRGAKADLDTRERESSRFESCGSPLHYAAYFGFSAVAQVLITAGATVDLVNAYGCSPLSHAIGQDHIDTARVLLSNGASPNVKCNSGKPLYSLANGEGLEALVEAGLDVITTDDEGWTPLHHAASSYMDDSIGTLNTAGAHLNAQDKDGRTPLWIACDTVMYPKTNPVIEELLRRGADDTISDSDGQSPADGVRTTLALKERPGNMRASQWKTEETFRPVREEILAMLIKHRAWRRRGWLLMLRQRGDPGGVVGAAGWVVRCPDEGVFRMIMEFV